GRHDRRRGAHGGCGTRCAVRWLFPEPPLARRFRHGARTRGLPARLAPAGALQRRWHCPRAGRRSVTGASLMCLAVPGKLISTNDAPALQRMGRVSFGGIVKEVSLAYVPEAEIGDYVIVH